jgi:predicted DNA-binding transcriptional regulator AlpA
MDQLLKASEVAAKLSTSVNALAVLRCKGKGPKFVKIGRSVRYRMSDLQDYIAALAPEA